MNKIRTNKIKKITKLELTFHLIVITAAIIIYLINFTTIGLDLGFSVKPSVIFKKEVSFIYQNFCFDDARPIDNYNCRTNKKLLNKTTDIGYNFLKKNKYLKYFPSLSSIDFSETDGSISKKDIEAKLNYIDENKITELRIPEYNGSDLDFINNFKNLDSLIITEAHNIDNIDDIEILNKLDFVIINNKIIRKVVDK